MCPEGPERHLDAARQKLPRDNFCAIALTTGAILKEEKMASTVGGERQFGRHFKRESLGEGNCRSKIAARQWGVNFCSEASRCLAEPSGWAQNPTKAETLYLEKNNARP